MKLLGAIGILFCVQLQGVFAVSTKNDDVPGFVNWAEQTAYTECTSNGGQGDAADNAMAQACKNACTQDAQGTHSTAWDPMCDTLGHTIKCENIPDTGKENELFTAFIYCWDDCTSHNTSCCAECPNPVEFFLYWAEHDCKNDVCRNSSAQKHSKVLRRYINADVINACIPAKPVSMTYYIENLSWSEMCVTLNDKIGCSGLQKPSEYPYRDFKTCCVSCEKESDVVNDQMLCCADCWTKITPPTTESTTVTADNTTEESSTSAPLLPPTAIWAKVTILTAMIAQLL